MKLRNVIALSFAAAAVVSLLLGDLRAMVLLLPVVLLIGLCLSAAYRFFDLLRNE